MKKIALTVMTSMALAAAGVANAQETLAKASGCLNCHAVEGKKVAPSFKDLAAKHKGKPDAEATLVAKLTAAKEHPAVKAKPEDVKALVKWALSL